MKPNKGGKTRLIGLSGGAGSGKSEVITYLVERWGAEPIILDDVARGLQSPGGACYAGMCSLFPEAVLDDGSLDRRKIGEMVYINKDLLAALNDLVHPAVRIETDRLIAEYRREEKPLVVLECALLYESGYDCICDEVWYIYAGEETRIRRLKTTRLYSDDRIRGIFENQMAEEELSSRADRIVNNDGLLESTRSELDKYCKEILKT